MADDITDQPGFSWPGWFMVPSWFSGFFFEIAQESEELVEETQETYQAVKTNVVIAWYILPFLVGLLIAKFLQR